MKKLFLLALLPIAVLTGLVGGCGLLDMDDCITITLPAQEFPFDLDANVAKAEIQAYINTLDPPLNSLDITNETEIPEQVCVQPYGCVDVPRIQESVTIDVPAQQIDLRDQQDLQAYIQAGKVKKVSIDYIEYQIATNTLNFDLPEIMIYLDEIDTTTLQADSDKVARIPSIVHGTLPTDRVQFTVDGRQKMSDYLIQEFAFAFLAQTIFTFDTDVTRTIPGGRLVGKVVVQVSFQVDPI